MKPQEALEALVDVLAGEPKLAVATIARGARKDDPPEARILKLAGDAEGSFGPSSIRRLPPSSTLSLGL